MASLQDLMTFRSIQNWRLTGRDAIVKVVSVQDAERVTCSKAARGYITQAKFLKGMTSLGMEGALGLRPNSLTVGAYLFWFARLPRADEVVHRFDTALPAGKVWTDELERRFMDERAKMPFAPTALVDAYPPGSSRILQWELMKPVPLAGTWKLVTPTFPFDL